MCMPSSLGCPVHTAWQSRAACFVEPGLYPSGLVPYKPYRTDCHARVENNSWPLANFDHFSKMADQNFSMVHSLCTCGQSNSWRIGKVASHFKFLILRSAAVSIAWIARLMEATQTVTTQCQRTAKCIRFRPEIGEWNTICWDPTDAWFLKIVHNNKRWICLDIRQYFVLCEAIYCNLWDQNTDDIGFRWGESIQLELKIMSENPLVNLITIVKPLSMGVWL